MSKMAVYDKKYGAADRAIFSYFRRDYIYRKNMMTRLCVSIGSIILLIIYWLHQIFIYGVDIQEIDIRQSVIDSVLFLIAVMAFYTLIGTIQGTHQYHKVQKRMDRYMAVMQKVDNMPDAPEPANNKSRKTDLLYKDPRQNGSRSRPGQND